MSTVSSRWDPCYESVAVIQPLKTADSARQLAYWIVATAGLRKRLFRKEAGRVGGG